MNAANSCSPCAPSFENAVSRIFSLAAGESSTCGLSSAAEPLFFCSAGGRLVFIAAANWLFRMVPNTARPTVLPIERKNCIGKSRRLAAFPYSALE